MKRKPPKRDLDGIANMVRAANSPPAPTVYQVPPLVLDENEIKTQLREQLKREPDGADVRMRKLDLELQHFFARDEPDPDRTLRYLLAIEYGLSWADVAFSAQHKRPWDNDTFKGSLHAAISHALNVETLKR